MKWITCVLSIIIAFNTVAFSFEDEQKTYNEAGEIMVLMYHGLEATPSASHQRSYDGFRSDLEKLYKNGYRVIPLKDLANNEINVPKGYSPVVITFDDGLSSAFSLIEEDGKLIPKPGCAVDIMNEFSENHPDFGKAATFYICLEGLYPFVGAGTLKDRFSYLIENGYDLGNHTYSHKMLAKLDADEIQKEFALVEKTVNDVIPNYKMISVAYPYGSKPKGDLAKYCLNGSYGGINYNYKLALSSGQCGYSSVPNNKNFNEQNVPRVRGSNNERMDLGWYIKYFEKNPESRYVSDSNPKTITVPVDYAAKVKACSLKGKELNVYTKNSNKIQYSVGSTSSAYYGKVELKREPNL